MGKHSSADHSLAHAQDHGACKRKCFLLDHHPIRDIRSHSSGVVHRAHIYIRRVPRDMVYKELQQKVLWSASRLRVRHSQFSLDPGLSLGLQCSLFLENISDLANLKLDKPKVQKACSVCEEALSQFDIRRVHPYFIRSLLRVFDRRIHEYALLAADSKWRALWGVFRILLFDGCNFGAPWIHDLHHDAAN